MTWIDDSSSRRVIRRERYAGTFSRSFALGGEVDEANAKPSTGMACCRSACRKRRRAIASG
ncbi:hypothetical protein HDG37_000074 [Paraburkholderia sp. MM5384-R2]|nr:hypothetical protein [Paraburkholderia sp. MM5384-R2]